MSKEMQIQESISQNQQRLTQHLIKQNSRYRKALELIREMGIHGTDIETKEVVRSSESSIAHDALEEST